MKTDKEWVEYIVERLGSNGVYIIGFNSEDITCHCIMGDIVREIKAEQYEDDILKNREYFR